MSRTVAEVLDELESRFREQANHETFLSTPWRAFMACVAHVEEIRMQEGLRE